MKDTGKKIAPDSLVSSPTIMMSGSLQAQDRSREKKRHGVTRGI